MGPLKAAPAQEANDQRQAHEKPGKEQATGGHGRRELHKAKRGASRLSALHGERPGWQAALVPGGSLTNLFLGTHDLQNRMSLRLEPARRRHE